MEEEEEPGPSRVKEEEMFNFDLLPGPAAGKLFEHLEFEEMTSLEMAVATRGIENLVRYGKILLNARIKKCPNFIWRRYFEENEKDKMAPRSSHSMVYHQGEGAFYIFGGRGVNDVCSSTRWEGAGSACFNDLFKLDMKTKKLSRIQVTTTPYPLPKCGASMNIYKDQILLFGGRKPLPNAFAMGIARAIAEPNTNEIHIFDTRESSWKKMVTNNDGPTLFGHSAVISNDLLITFGGQLNSHTLNTTFRVLDLKKSRWFMPTLPGVPTEFHVHGSERIATEFPIHGTESTSLIKLKDGHLLLLGECRPPGRRNVAVIISFDEQEPEKKSWQWKCIPASGKWFDNGVRLVGPSKHRNSDFAKVVPLYGDGFVRLVTVGLPSSYFHKEKPQVDHILALGLSPDDADVFVDWKCGLQAVLAFTCIRSIRTIFENGVRRMIQSREKDHLPMDFTFDRAGVHVEITNLYQLFHLKVNIAKLKTKFRVWLDREGERFLGEIDCRWLESVLRRAARHFSDHFYQEYEYQKQLSERRANSSMRFRVAHRPSIIDPVPIWRNIPHLVSYSAFIPLGPDWTPSDLSEIVYEEGESHFNCPPPIHNFAFAAGPAEVVLHGGELELTNKHHPVTYQMICSPRHHF